MKFRLVLLLDDNLNKLSEELSTQIGDSFETYFSLDSTHIPHITITTITFDDENEIEEIVEQAKVFGSKINSREMEISGIEHDGEGFVSIHFTNDQWISELHEKANEVFGKKYTVKTEKFIPHLTLTRLKNEREVEVVLDKFKIERENYSTDTIAICESGQNGTCTKILVRYS